MGKLIWRGRRLYIGGRPMHGNTNDINIDFSAEIKDATVDNSTAKEKLPGLRDWKLNAAGLWEANDDTDALDEWVFSKLGLSGEVMLATPTKDATVGDIAYFGKIVEGSYSPFGKVGEVTPFKVTAEGDSRLARGAIDVDSALTTSSNSTGRVISALGSSGSAIWACVQILAVAGTSPTLDVIVERDNNSGFTSAETAITFTQFGAIGAQFLYVVGPTTDNYWRFKWTIGGSAGPSFTALMAMGWAFV